MGHEKEMGKKNTHKEAETGDTCAQEKRERCRARRKGEKRCTHTHDYLRNLMSESRANESAWVKVSSVWDGSPRLVPSGERMVAR